MRKTPITIFVLGVIFLAVAILTLSLDSNFILKSHSENIPYTHSFTKAFCNSNNNCEDFEIFCKNKEIIRIEFAGAAVKFPEAWQDPRNDGLKNKIC